MQSPSVDAVKAAFEAVDPMTVGLEEEAMLLTRARSTAALGP